MGYSCARQFRVGYHFCPCKELKNHGQPTFPNRHPHRRRWHHRAWATTRVPKSAPRVQAVGDVDELNSHIGLLLCEDLPTGVRELLVDIQHQLFNLGGGVVHPGLRGCSSPKPCCPLDQALEDHNANLPRLREFILPAGTRAAAQAHVCRTVARRAERAVVALGAQETLNPHRASN